MRINNKKGFTIIEVVLSFTFAIIILASMFAIVINYQNRTEKEKIVSNLLTYKNGILEIVYQDVIGSNIESMETCGGKCIKINIKGNTNKPEDKVTYKLEGKVDADGNSYIEYRDNNYVLPDSKNDLSKIEDFGYQIDDDNKIYKIEIPITHAELDDEENEENTIEIVVSGKEFEKPVNKLDNPTKVVAVENIIYDDIEHELVEITKLKGVFYYSYDTVLDSNNYKDGSTDIPTKKEAGTYTIYYYIEGTDDYLAKSGIITVVISQRAVTFKADDASKGYDGTVLEKKTASLISGSLVEGHTATFDITGSIIEDGVVENVLNNVLIRDAKGNDVTKNYNITKVNGTLKITLVCEWVQKSTSTPTSCTATSKNSNPSNGDTYTYCSSKKYGDWRYSMVVNCNNGSSSTITSKYNFTSQSNASQACNSIPSDDSFCPGSAVNGRSCGTSQLVYYQKIVYEYQCSTKSDTVTLSNQEFSYTGSPVEVKDATSLSGTPITYEYYSSTDCSGEVMGEAPINVGTYSVKAISAGNANSTNQSGNLVYTGSSTCATVKINKGTPNVFLKSSTQEYTGNSLGTTASSTKPNGEHVELEYTYKYFTGNSCSGTALNGSPIDAGTYSVIATSKENNNLVSASSGCASFVVTPKVITYTSQASDKVYDGNTNATCTITLQGIAARDNVSATSTGTFDNKNAGQGKTVTCSNVTLTGTGVNNYKITSTSATTKANITQKTLTVANFTYSPLTKVYDGKTTVPSGFSVTGTTGSGVISGDNVIIGYTSAAYNDANVANANSITVSGLNISGTSASNYKLSATTYTKTGATITKATGTVSISAKTETYTGSAISIGTASTNSGGTVTYTYYNGESCSGAALSGAPKNVGKYSVKATLAATGNYTTATSNCAKLTINAKTLTYTASASNKTYDGNTSTTCSITLTGVVSGDSVSASARSATFANKNVGTGKTVTCSNITLSGSSASNYTLSSTSTTTTANITAKVLTPLVSANSKIYDGGTGTSCFISFNAVVSGDSVSASAGSATFSDKNVGTGKTVTCSGITLSGTSAGNYKLSSTSVTTTAIIAQKTLTVADFTYSPLTKVYNGNTSAPSGFKITASGVVSGDSVSVSYTSAAYNDANVANANSITVSGMSISGTSASNYKLSATSYTKTGATITKATGTVSISAKTETYTGSAISIGTASTNSGGTVTYTYYSGESCSGTALSETPTNAGTYSVKATVAATGNYTSATSACVKHTINQRAVTYKSDSASKAYNGTALTKKTATLISGSLLSGHTASFEITGSQTSVGTSTNTLNSVTIKDSNGNDVTSNYSITKQNGTLTVLDGTPPTITFSPNGNSKAAKSQSTKVTVTDNASTVSERKYLWSQSNNTSAENGTSFTSGQTITKSDDNGSWYLCVYAKDSTGNATNVCSNFFELDNTPPTITAGDFCALLGTTIDPSINVTVSDESAVTVTATPSSLPSTTIGQTNVTYTATDEAGNTATKTVVASVFTKLYDSKLVTSGAGLYRDPIDDARYIYKGADAKNYVRFNGSDNWRILSIEESGAYKLIYMGTDLSAAYNSANKNALTFTGTAMDTLLNTTFYGNLNDTSKKMVVSHEFNYGVGNVNRTTTSVRLSGLYENERTTKITTKVGLMTLTDFFRASNSANCTDSQTLNNVSGGTANRCNEDNWLYTNGYEFWTFTPYNDGGGRMYHLTTTGGYQWDYLTYSHPYRPVVHITDEAVFVSGDGSAGNPYIIDTDCAGTVPIPELQSCSITRESGYFKVVVNGGSGSFQYAWNGGAYQSSKKLAFSSVASGNPITAGVTVQDKKTSNTVSCSTTCTFTGWSRVQEIASWYLNDMEYTKGEAEAANNTWYRDCGKVNDRRTCETIGGLSADVCYSCIDYGRSMTCS